MNQPSTYRVLMAAGGTGGHVYPAIAIADAIKDLVPGADIRFAGTRTHMEWNAVPKAGYKIEPIWISGFHRRITVQNLLFPIKLVISLLQSWNILRKFKPDVVVCCGGYVSGPIGRMAGFLKIPLMLQEQNSYPGVTNRLLGKSASLIFTAFDEAAQWFPEEKVRQTGNPVRKDVTNGNRSIASTKFAFNTNQKTVLIMGGSGGAKSLNDAMERHLDELHNKHELQIIWQCGKNYLPQLKERINEGKYPNLRLTDFLDDMPGVYALADVIVCRAGAGTIAELMVTGSVSVLVPSPYVAGNHQFKNAKAVVDKGAAEMIPDENLGEMLPEVILRLLADRSKSKAMSDVARSLAAPNASNEIAKQIISVTTAGKSLEK